MKKKVYKKKKSVTSRRKPLVRTHLKSIAISIPYVLTAIIFIGGILYYIQFCLLYSYANISFPPQKAFADSNRDESIINNEIFPFKDEGMGSLPEAHEQIINHGPRHKKEVALTFDADMTEMMEDFLCAAKVKTYAGSNTVEFLKQNDIKATLFLTGMWIETYPEETKKLAGNPLFELANHSYSHPSFSGTCYGLPHISSSEYPAEIEKTQRLLFKFTNKKAKYFRFPGGCYDQSVLDLVNKEGMETVHWDAPADDGFNENTDQIIANVLNRTQNGSIIVMHMGGESNTPKTLDALHVIYTQLKEKGYKFVTVSELLKPEATKQTTDLKKYLLLAKLM